MIPEVADDSAPCLNRGGRPKSEDPRCLTIQFQVNPKELEDIRSAALRDKVTVSEFCRTFVVDISVAINAGELDD